MEHQMEETCYEMNLPRENIHLRCFAHSIMNYRYHWHTDEYELSIVLHGNSGILPWYRNSFSFRG